MYAYLHTQPHIYRVHTCVHASMNTQIHQNKHIHVHAYLNTQIHQNEHINVHVCSHRQTLTHVHAYLHTQTHYQHTHACLPAHTDNSHMCMLTCSHRHTTTHMHASLHTQTTPICACFPVHIDTPPLTYMLPCTHRHTTTNNLGGAVSLKCPANPLLNHLQPWFPET